MTTHAQLIEVANWHAEKAGEAYLSGLMDLFTRHIAVADELRSISRIVGVQTMMIKRPS